MRKRLNIVMLGPQGSGKGTQAGMISKKFGIPHISTGDIFREMEKKNTVLGRKVRSLIDSGKLVPDEVTDQIARERLKRKDAARGFVLDGYPRDLEQAAALHTLQKITHCIVIDITDRESMKRIGARRVCSACAANYNTIYIRPKKAGVCDKCGGKLAMRDDDRPAAVRLRLRKYHEATEPLIRFYEKDGVLVRINGAQSIAKVFSDIKKKII